MKKILIPMMLLLLSIGAFADNRVKLVAWGAFSRSDENKFLEELGLKSSLGLSDLWIGNEKYSLSGYFLPNQNADLRLLFFIRDKWRLTAGFRQYRKWWDTSAGHETTPGGYKIANWVPNTNTISPLSDRDELHTTRRVGSIQLDYLLSPLQQASFGFRCPTRNGRLTPFFGVFTFGGDVAFAGAAISAR